MGLLSGIIKGVGRVAQTIRDLPGKLNRWDLSRDVKRNTKPVQTVADIPVADWRMHRKRHVSAGAPVATPEINDEIDALRKRTEELQRLNDMYRRAIEAGGKYGNAKASDDAAKLANQQRVADAIDAEREAAGAVPGSEEWEEARASAIAKIRAGHLAGEWADPSDPDLNRELQLTAEEQAAIDAMPDNPWTAL